MENIGGYRPSKATKRDYSELLSHVQRLFSDQPFHVIQNATSFVLEILKSDLNDNEKFDKLQNEISNDITEEFFGEIYEIAEKINTFKTSILPYEDCCTVFLPEHPIIKPKLDKVRKEESKLDIEGLIADAIENVEIIEIK